MSDASTEPRSTRARFRKLLHIIGSLFIGVVLLELSLRGLGLAASVGSAPSASNDPSEYRILCLGDSWTHGLDSISYGEALQGKLDGPAADGRTYSVVRSGIPGSNSSQGIRRLNRLLREDSFDMLIVLLGNNDHQNLADSEYWKFESEPGFTERLYGRARVFTHSLRTYKLGKTLQLKLTGEPTLDEFFFADTPNEPVKNTVIELDLHRRQLEHNLTRIVDTARLHDVELVFMTYFYFHGYEVNESILDVASTFDLQVVNNTVLFHERIPEERRGEFFYGAHPTTEGHDFIADNIVELVEFR